MNIFGAATCTFAAFKEHLKHSPAHIEAQEIWAVLVLRKVDPAVALGFFHHESSCGTMGRAIQTKSWGNLRWHDVYSSLPYPVKNIDGFCAYQTFTNAAIHFADHLLGRDGTNDYSGLTTVESVVPVWAPRSDGNSPSDYIGAVESFAAILAGGTIVKPRVLLVAGHNNAAGITEEGLCDNLDKTASAARLRSMTGANGEAAYVGDFVQRLARSLSDKGVDAQFVDCTYHKDLFIDWKPTLVHVAHYHRDAPAERAMFACPDPGLGFYSPEAHDKSQLIVDYFNSKYEQATGIPVTPPLVTLAMRQLYTWCYIDKDSLAFISELGNANVDSGIMYSNVGMDKIVAFHADAIISLIGSQPVPAPAPAPTPVPAPAPGPISVRLRVIADEVEVLEKK